jgi:hypothetical protein
MGFASRLGNGFDTATLGGKSISFAGTCHSLRNVDDMYNIDKIPEKNYPSSRRGQVPITGGGTDI